MKVLITGCCGFIGFSFSQYLLNKNKKIKIVGVDSLNNYYSTKLKKDRLTILKKQKKRFKFLKQNLKNKYKLRKIFLDNNFDQVFHFAAQAGVRFSFNKPYNYLDSNIVSYLNLLELCKEHKVKKIFFSSSSSVYGDTKKLPVKENAITKEKNLYAVTKVFNEKISEIYSEKYNMQIIGLRFFTVYGEWGRPDMFIMKYINAGVKKKLFYLYNYGKHKRDFTYIEDVLKILIKISKKRFKKKYDIFNICSSKPIKLDKIITEINKNFIAPKIILKKRDFADVLNTHGSNKKILSKIGKFNFTKINVGIDNLCKWYKKYYFYN